jgi:hypothetical protein
MVQYPTNEIYAFPLRIQWSEFVFIETPLFGKGYTIPHEKLPALIDMKCLVKGMDNSTLNFT